MPTPPVANPFYLDWTFWSFVVAFCAIVLSQLPPIHLLLKPRRIEVEVNSRILVTHKVGNPNVTLHVSVRNNGGRVLRIRGFMLNIFRNNKQLISMPSQNYYEKFTDPSSTLLAPFSLKPGEDWVHGVNFLNFFDRANEKLYRASEAALRNDINKKLRIKKEEDKNHVIADPVLVEPFMQLFERLFIWEPGEYIVELTVVTAPKSAMYSKKYRFTLYESDTAELRNYANDYQYGGGICFNWETHIGVFAPLSEHPA